MKHFSFLLLFIGLITVTMDTQCMLVTLRNTKRLQLPQQKRFCSQKITLEQKVNKLESEVALIKAILAQQSNNNQPSLSDENLPSICKSPIEYKWDLTHYGNQ